MPTLTTADGLRLNANVLDISGQIFNQLTAIKPVRHNLRGKLLWEFECSCGVKIITIAANVKNGKTASCGCLRRKLLKLRAKHGLSSHQLYPTWKGMKQRCYNSNNTDYKWYGLIGITICPEWRENAANFIAWSEENGYKQGLQLDRIDNGGPYAPFNCRWTTSKINNNNRSDNVRTL